MILAPVCITPWWLFAVKTYLMAGLLLHSPHVCVHRRSMTSQGSTKKPSQPFHLFELHLVFMDGECNTMHTNHAQLEKLNLLFRCEHQEHLPFLLCTLFCFLTFWLKEVLLHNFHKQIQYSSLEVKHHFIAFVFLNMPKNHAVCLIS